MDLGESVASQHFSILNEIKISKFVIFLFFFKMRAPTSACVGRLTFTELIFG